MNRTTLKDPFACFKESTWTSGLPRSGLNPTEPFSPRFVGRHPMAYRPYSETAQLVEVEAQVMDECALQ